MSEIKETKIIINNHLPQAPVGEHWPDKCRDHDFFQLKVSEAAIQGGVSSTAGCMTPSAERARREAEDRYFKSQLIDPKKIIQKM